MNTAISTPRAGWLTLFKHNMVTAIMRKKHEEVVKLFDKELERLEKHGVTLSSQDGFLLLLKLGEESKMGWLNGNSAYLTLVALVVVQEDIGKHPRLKNLIGIAIGLQRVSDLKTLRQGLALRELKTHWEFLMWCVWVGVIGETFFKERMKILSHEQIEELKTLSLCASIPNWWATPVDGLKLLS